MHIKGQIVAIKPQPALEGVKKGLIAMEVPERNLADSARILKDFLGMNVGCTKKKNLVGAAVVIHPLSCQVSVWSRKGLWATVILPPMSSVQCMLGVQTEKSTWQKEGNLLASFCCLCISSIARGSAAQTGRNNCWVPLHHTLSFFWKLSFYTEQFTRRRAE